MAEPTFFGLKWHPPPEVSGGIIAVLTVVAGAMSGLTLCLFSMDKNRLHALSHGPNTKDARRARRVLMLLHKPHWLLVTLLLLDALAVELMPLMFDLFLPPAAAIFSSVGLILVFGEIIPQAAFVRYALPVSAAFVYPVLFLMCLTSPISWTTGKLLDLVVGNKEAVFFRRRELREILRIQEGLRHHRLSTSSMSEINAPNSSDSIDDERKGDPGLSDGPTNEEVNIMLGALSLSENHVSDVMGRKIDAIFKVHRDSLVTRDVTEYIFHSGAQWVGVYDNVDEPNNITHVLVTKILILLIYSSPAQPARVRDLPLQALQTCPASATCNEFFQQLQVNNPHIMAVTSESGSIVGVISLTDILETMYKVIFSSEVDPRNASPMQVVMRTWERVQAREMAIAHFNEEQQRMEGHTSASNRSVDRSRYRGEFEDECAPWAIDTRATSRTNSRTPVRNRGGHTSRRGISDSASSRQGCSSRVTPSATFPQRLAARERGTLPPSQPSVGNGSISSAASIESSKNNYGGI